MKICSNLCNYKNKQTLNKRKKKQAATKNLAGKIFDKISNFAKHSWVFAHKVVTHTLENISNEAVNTKQHMHTNEG